MTASPSDADLVRAANQGDPGAFAALYQRHRQWVVDTARRHTGDDDLALDVMQEVFLHLLGRFPGFELRSALRTYLYPVIRHVAISRQRRDRREAPGSTAFAGGRAAGPGPDPDRESLEAALARLPAGQREVILLRYGDDLSLQDVAAALGLPLGTVKSRLHHATIALREMLGEDFFREP